MKHTSPIPPNQTSNQNFSRMDRLARYTVLQGSKPRTIVALGAVSVGDFFAPALPTQTSVIALGLMQPSRWLWIALIFAAASATGVLLLATLLSLFTEYAQQFDPERIGNDWNTVMTHLREWGLWAVLLFSMLPSPPRLLTAATLISGMGPWAVAAAVFTGRMVWLSGFLLLLTRAPQLFARVPFIGRGLQRFEAFQREVLRTPN
jgi:membrane protein YqaA with SNARE-associated domain